MNKPFEVEFNVDAKILSIIYICWKYKYPLSYFLSFYEMFGAQTLFILKALSCTKRLMLNDGAFTNIIEQSRKLHNQIIKGISTNLKIKTLELKIKSGKLIEEDIPEHPTLNLSEFDEEYSQFIREYLVKNVVNIFSETFTLKLNTRDLYQALK